jgi:ribonuclease BN (tRNA processing enzyme)
MKVIFLGTNGWYDTKMGNTVCTLIDSQEGYVILDAGDGIYKAKKYITEDRPIYLFISHLHLDHISGFHIFPDFLNNKKVQIILEKGNKELLESIVKHPFMAPLRKDIIFQEFSEGKQGSPLNFECLRLKHVDPVFGYRIYLENKIIAYCLDTGICDNVKKLSRDADLLITECSMLPGFSNQKWGHLNSAEAANIAKEAQVKKMALTHLSVDFKSGNQKKEAEKIAQKIFENSLIAEDDLVIEI